MSVITTPTEAPAEVDARIPRFTATVTAAVIGTALAVSPVSPVAAAVILFAQAAVFAIGAVWGPQRHPYGAFFSAVIAPRLGPVTKRDYVAQLRFSMMLGAGFCVIGATAFVLGATRVGLVAAGFALFAAIMRATFGICLGRGPYMLVSRLRGQVPACCQNK